jgi:hypothetical protein
LEYLDGVDLNLYISLLQGIESVRQKSKKCIINWYYEDGDEDIFEKEEYISLAVYIPYNITKICELKNNHTDLSLDSWLTITA